MAVLTIRNVPAAVHHRLRARAAKSGRSMEAEARVILAAAVQDVVPESSLEIRDWVDVLYGDKKPTGVADALLGERRKEAADDARA
ncbi:MAG: plasmid stabilization protein [Lentisphaeria bacterium]